MYFSLLSFVYENLISIFCNYLETNDVRRCRGKSYVPVVLDAANPIKHLL